MHPGHLWACASWRLGPLSVGLAAKSQSGKANFETCTRQLWELSKEPWNSCLMIQAKSFHAGVSKVPWALQVPAPTP